MKKTLLLLTMVTFVVSLNAVAAPVTFFSNLGPPGNVYNCCAGWVVSGTGYVGTSYTQANPFISEAAGSVSQINLGVTYVDGENSFYAALYTDDHGRPGTLLRRWDNLTSSQHIGGCCALVNISGISGLTLTQGQKYFMVLGPMSVDDSSFLTWALNTTNYLGIELISTDGGTTWGSAPSTSLSGAFEILGQ
jgi:hypothetical protein